MKKKNESFGKGKTKKKDRNNNPFGNVPVLNILRYLYMTLFLDICASVKLRTLRL